jgi:hypothetical protein
MAVAFCTASPRFAIRWPTGCVVWRTSLAATWVTYGFFGRQLEFDLYWEIVKDGYRKGAVAARQTAPDPMHQLVKLHFETAYEREERAMVLDTALADLAETPQPMQAATPETRCSRATSANSISSWFGAR